MAKEPVKRNEPNSIDKSIATALDNINGNMNFAGFTKRFVTNLPSEAEKGLTDKQQEMAVLILVRYRRQISNYATILNSLPEQLRKVAADYLKGLKTK